MADNYDSVIDQLQAHGLLVTSLEAGELRRCKVEGRGHEKKGWYHLHEVPKNDASGTLLVGTFGIWQGTDPGTVKVEIKSESLTPEQRQAIKQRLADDRKRQLASRKREAQVAAEKATRTWRALSETGENEYLARKGVQAFGIRFSPKSGAIYIPMADAAGNIGGLQVIKRPGPRGGGLQKRFWPTGMQMKGLFHMIGVPTWVVLVCEGYATGATLHQATGGLPVACAFSANNLLPVATALRKRYRNAKILICADDDSFTEGNPGIDAASAAALAVGGEWVAPQFPDANARNQAYKSGDKWTDFNDLHASAGLPAVRQQIDNRLTALKWRPRDELRRGVPEQGGGGDALQALSDLSELLERFALVYGQGGTVFDRKEHMLMALSDMRDACLRRELHRDWMEHPARNIVRVEEVGFDPTGTDTRIKCNLWGGWPTVPKAGCCDRLIDLLHHMCSDDEAPEETADWVLRWLAYPIQHPGAKMKTTLVLHGSQGAGKNLFFEAVMAIYGQYGRVIDQDTVESQFNDWISRKLFLIADEVVARQELYKVKNKLKGIITGDWIRVNPKGRSPYDERNCCNLVFLSNESVPVVLEEGDRRYTVIWTADKLPAEFYTQVLAEIRNGGIAALHHHLLNIDLGNFHPGTPPPYTNAKGVLTRMSADSVTRFFQDLEAGDIGDCTLRPCESTELYRLYRNWCGITGQRYAKQDKLLNTALRRHKASSVRKRIMTTAGIKQRRIVMFGGHRDPPPGESEATWLGNEIDAFRISVDDFIGQGGYE